MRFHHLCIPFLALMTSTTIAQRVAPPGRTKSLEGQVVESRQLPPDDAGVAKHLKVIRTNLRYPLIRVEQDVRRDPATGQETIVRTQEMVADHVIVRLRPGKGREHLKLKGWKVREVLRIPDLFLVELPQQSIDAVTDAVASLGTENALVRYVEPDGVIRLNGIPNDPGFNQLWGMHNTGQTGGTEDADIDAPEAWDIATSCAGIRVGILDTGIDYNHPDLAANIWTNPVDTQGDANEDGCPGVCGVDDDGDGLIDEDSQGRQPGEPGYSNDLVSDDDENGYPDDIHGWDFADDDNDPLDTIYHGTHVAGIVGAVADNGDVVDNGIADGVAGVCWSVQMVSIKIFPNYDETAFVSWTAKAIDYATQLGVALTNNSWGGYIYSHTLFDAVSRADQAGVLFCASAGNRGTDNDGSAPAYPCSFPLANVISVAATDHTDSLVVTADWASNYGAVSVDLGAPGKDILSTFPTYRTPNMDYWGLASNYETISGTSMAAPHVSGACALLKSLVPSASHTQIKRAVLGTVDSVPALQGLVLTGGRLNLFKIVDSLQHPDGDGDGTGDFWDNCPNNYNPDQEDGDGDGWGDVCDNCPADWNPEQEDCDGDTQGDACDSDDDDDGIPDEIDNCDCIPNVDQVDCDNDGQGNACDATPGPLGDFDDDCDVDQSDFAHMQACQGSTCSCGPGPGCDCCESAWPCYDAWFSGYVTYEPYDVIRKVVPEDMVLFERCISSPGVAMTSVCGDCNDDGVHDAQQDFDGDDLPDGDADRDGVDVRGWPICTTGQTTNCDDNCACLANADQLDSDGDGIGDACDPTPNGPPPPAPPVTIQVLAWRSMREHGIGNWLGVALDPALTADSATIEPRQGIVQVIEADLSDAAGASSDLGAVLVFDDEANLITPNDVYLDNGDTTVVITFVDDPMVDDDFLLDEKCYLVYLYDAIEDAQGNPPVGDADCAIRMLAADVDGDGIVEEVDDEGAIEAANGQATGASTLRMDIDTDGTIAGTENTGADWLIVHALLGNTVTCSGGGMMMMGMGGGVGLAGGADALVGTSDASDLLSLLRQQAATPSANVSAQWVVHGTGATTVTLPAGGGTVAVDLVVTTDTPIWGFEGKLAVNVANAVSINSADWTELGNVLFSHDVDGHNQSSYYDLTVMDWLWVRLTPDGTDVTAWGMDVDSLLGADPPTVWTLTQDLTPINGPIATPTAEPAIEEQESAQWFTTTAGIGGVTREPLPAGQTILATLSLTISAQPGTYHLTLTDAQVVDTIHVTYPATTGQPLQIVVGQ